MRENGECIWNVAAYTDGVGFAGDFAVFVRVVWDCEEDLWPR